MIEHLKILPLAGTKTCATWAVPSVKAESPELLESRIAPATLVNPRTVTYTDIDGDTVVVKTNRGAFDINDFVFFDAGDGREQLQLLALGGDFDRARISVTVTKPGPEGDGFANIGAIETTSIRLTSLTIEGDLGRIQVDDVPGAPVLVESPSSALGTLKVRSIGMLGTDTQGEDPSLESLVDGSIGKLIVSGDIKDARILVGGRVGLVSVGGSIIGGNPGPAGGGAISAEDFGIVKIGGDLRGGLIETIGNIASVSIGGSVIGGAENSSGAIRASQKIGFVRITGDIIGGSAIATGQIISETEIKSAQIGGSLIGGDGVFSGSIISDGGLGSINIRGNVVGDGVASAQISAGTGIESVTIKGSMTGGIGESSAHILCSVGDIGAIKIGGDLKGGAGDESGKIDSGRDIAAISIGGSVTGLSGDYDTGTRTGQIFAQGSIGNVRIRGDLSGGDGGCSGSVFAAGRIGNIDVSGSFAGGAGNLSGSVLSETGAGLIRIGRDIAGGSGDNSGIIFVPTGKGVMVEGSIIGGTGPGAGSVNSEDGIDFVKIGKDLVGGEGGSSAILRNVRDVTVGGLAIGGSNSFTGCIAANEVRLDSVRIGGDLIGGTIGENSPTVVGSGYIESAVGIGRVLIGGSMVSGIDGSQMGDLERSASIRSNGSIDSLTVKGGIVGHKGANGDSRVVISAAGTAEPGRLAIGSVVVGGEVEWTNILAGYNIESEAVSADAQIGSVKVGGDWIASNIAAGVINLGDDQAEGGTDEDADNVNFGDFNDSKIDGVDSEEVISRIGRIQISGTVFGTAEEVSDADSFGFVAEEIGTLKIGKRLAELGRGPDNDSRLVTSSSPDVRLLEIGAIPEP